MWKMELDPGMDQDEAMKMDTLDFRLSVALAVEPIMYL